MRLVLGARRAARLPAAARSAVPRLHRTFASPAASSTIDVATVADLKANAVLPSEGENDAVSFASTKLAFKPRPSTQRVAVEASRVFCGSNDPLAHTEDDIGRFFQFDGSNDAYEIFYHNGFCGEKVAARTQQLKTSAMMVRRSGLRMRDNLLALDEKGTIADKDGWIFCGDAGVGKSMILNYVIAAMQRAGWLVAVMPHAADWTLGLSARAPGFANEAYRVSDPAFFTQVPPELEGSELYENPDASAHHTW